MLIFGFLEVGDLSGEGWRTGVLFVVFGLLTSLLLNFG